MDQEKLKKIDNRFQSVLDRLSLEKLDTYLYRFKGKNAGIQRIYGGQVIAQAYIAANSTLDEDVHLHSLHAYFLRPGVIKQPVLFSVDPIRDGRSFFTRTVKAIQNNEVIFTMSVSFHKHEEGFSHSIDMPDIPGPEELKTEIEMREENIDLIPEDLRPFFLKEREISLKIVEWNDVFDPQKLPPVRNLWMKPNGKLPDKNEIHHAFLSYVSDSGLLAPCLYPHGLSYMSPNLMMASLDHTMWFHKQNFRWDDWILYSTDSPYTGNARGLGRGTFFTREGDVVSSVTQEGLLRIKTS
ncbi:MAG: acyl-CoA thioesterase II [Gammaproteobacteria bacterium]|jgi:acyl-CoA thioesterase-2|nr:acyl-CoA thioesterase II [Gammaproteobacteria bacterium]|tara:strand:+ start:30 stop:920 length:891 start_codon:yes stop_codon:yes gene_type:complete